MRQTTKDKTKRTEKPFSEHLHESLVKHEVITNPRVVKCGTYYSWERFIKHRIQCEHIKECPICRDRTLDYRRHQMLEKQDDCLKDGGEILKIETVIMPGKGRMQITGKLGDVMQESIKAAKSFIRSKSLDYGIIPPLFEKKDFHIHVPEGATPKDGPSAGIGMVTSIVSAITNNPVRRDIAMTGEVTLTGQVLPIGGLKEKLLAAHRAGIKQVLIPKENEKDLVDMPKKIIDDIKITPVKHADEVLKLALTKELKAVEWVEVEKIAKKEDESQASIQ